MSANDEQISEGGGRGKGREGGVQKETDQNVEGYYSLGNLFYLLYSYRSSKISPIKKDPFYNPLFTQNSIQISLKCFLVTSKACSR